MSDAGVERLGAGLARSVVRPPPPAWVSWSIAGLLIAIVCYVRLAAAPDRVIPIAYGMPLLICLWFRNRTIVWVMVAAFTAVTAVKQLVLTSAADVGPNYSRLLNWTLIQIDCVLVAGVIHYVIGARRTLERRTVELEESNARLESREQDVAMQNEELRVQAEERHAQAEELHAQASELERATEELRVVNQELEDRERQLERLLELSQSLTANLSREQVMARICDAVDAVVGVKGAVAAALEEQDGGASFRVLAEWGVEVEAGVIAAESSLAALVLERGQTGFIEDLALRPDIVVPRSRYGAPIRSVLATPLRLEGGRRGTMELYTREPHAWTRQQIVMLEALAHQAATSLANVRLVDEIDRQRRWLETVLGTLPVGVITCDARGEHARMNASAARAHRMSADVEIDAEARAGRLGWRLERDGKPLANDDSPLLRAARFGEEYRGGEIELVFDDGARVTELVSAGPIRDRSGAIVGAVATLVDITQLKQLQRELEHRRQEAEEASVRKTRFLAAVSHDIRTPANAINLLAELMSRAAESPSADFVSEAANLARELQSAALSLVQLVSDVLDVTRYDYGKIDLQVSTFALGTFLEEQLRQHKPAAAAKGLELRVEDAAGFAAGTRLYTDAIKLGRALTNLIGNAIKFTERGGVTVRALPTAEGGVAIEVADSGIGMSAEHLPRIFDEFFQIQNIARDRTKGTGLGLAICKRLVEAMGGRLTVRSEVGRGSTFAIALPKEAVASRAAHVAAAEVNAAPPGRRLDGHRILLVEDHDLTRHAVARILSREGAAVTQAIDGASARRELGDGAFDTLLLDMMLPDLDGREILREMDGDGNRPAGIRTVVVLTGDVTAERTAEVNRLGADLLMHKPIDPQAIVEYLRGRVGV